MDKPLIKKLGLCLGSTLIYAFAFIPLYQLIWRSVGGFTILPLIVTAYYFGRWSGVLFGLLAIPLNVILVTLAGDPTFSLFSDKIFWVAHLVFMLVGFVVGSMSELRTKLQEELIERHRIEDELKQKNEQLERQKQLIDYDLEQARKIQLGILPLQIPNIPDGKLAAKYVPMRKIGGDLYDVIELSDKKIGIMLADVSGHGIPAALISFTMLELFKAHATAFSSPQAALEKINQTLQERLTQGKFITAFYCIYDGKTKRLDYTTAGHPPGYLLQDRTRQIIPLQTNGGILGVSNVFENFGQFEEKTVQLAPGDKIFLYTDGIMEMRNPQGKLFGQDRLEKFLLDHNQLPIEDLLEEIYNRVLMYSEKSEYNDDITLVAFELFK